jgi:hypothetical protein
MIVRRIVVLLALSTLVAASAASALVESKTGTEYPDRITVETPAGPATLVATGVGLREKTVMKVDVYTIVSYVDETAALGGAPADAILALDGPKRLQMDLRRSFSREKLVNSFVESIDRNFEDRSPFAADLERFLAYFQRDAKSGDRIVFDYAPQTGLTTSLNGEVKGVIRNAAFVQALWSVWFGMHPVNESLTRALVAQAAR